MKARSVFALVLSFVGAVAILNSDAGKWAVPTKPVVVEDDCPAGIPAIRHRYREAEEYILGGNVTRAMFQLQFASVLRCDSLNPRARELELRAWNSLALAYLEQGSWPKNGHAQRALDEIHEAQRLLAIDTDPSS